MVVNRQGVVSSKSRRGSLRFRVKLAPKQRGASGRGRTLLVPELPEDKYVARGGD